MAIDSGPGHTQHHMPDQPGASHMPPAQYGAEHIPHAHHAPGQPPDAAFFASTDAPPPPPGAYPNPYGVPYNYVYPYGQPYAGPMPPSTNGLAIASLICSLGSFFLLPGIAAVLGVILGHLSLAQIRASQGREEGRGMAIAGLILGYVNLALCVLIVVFVILVIAVARQQQGV